MPRQPLEFILTYFRLLHLNRIIIGNSDCRNRNNWLSLLPCRTEGVYFYPTGFWPL